MNLLRGVLPALALLCGLAGCGGAADPDSDNGRIKTSRAFPQADRAKAQSGASSVSSEVQRDEMNEAQTVMDLADIKEGMTVADIGAGEGYYTSRLGVRVGKKGRVLAQDIDAAALERLGQRVERERLDNVSIKLGAVDDPRLPQASFDRIFLVHMYREVSEPYAFLWRLRPALKPGGRLIVVDVDHPTDKHGIPPPLLFCELQAVGFRLTEFVRKPELQGYYAQFEAVGNRPTSAEIRPCREASGEAGRTGAGA